ncbi:hypothetical protein Ahy_B08g088990 isoform E [Arachis hypogaea]|uniref:Uncharacterized protein n=1 Tax=Arachis hypogaea TaxID=3818 RepID=A0A444XXE5_ARAHY|nr:hypothetical protein Ahy_B08g088990 isoform E [Arachis hypogaea]
MAWCLDFSTALLAVEIRIYCFQCSPRSKLSMQSLVEGSLMLHEPTKQWT